MADLNTVQIIRQKNFEALIGMFASRRDAGKRLDLSPSRISDYIKGTRPIGETLASRLERDTPLPVGTLSKKGWHQTLDIKPANRLHNSNNLDASSTMPANEEETPASKSGISDVSHYAAIPSVERMYGFEGRENDYYMMVPKAYLREVGTDSDNAAYFLMPDQSMYPRIPQNSSIAVNTDWGGEFKSSAQYGIKLGSTYTLRLVISQPNRGVILKAENTNIAPDMVLSEKEAADLVVLGEYICYTAR